MTELFLESDFLHMRTALTLAVHAASAGEVPVGAVVVQAGQIIGQGWNCPIGTNDPTAHAEIQALRAAAQYAQNYRLTGAVLYVTLEPCLMCVGAIQQARLTRVVYGAADVRWGARQHVTKRVGNHQTMYTGGLLADEAEALLKKFFASRR